MAVTLFDLSYRVARELAIVHEGVATGGSTTTIIDTVKLGRFGDDFFNLNDLGSAWILEDSAGAGAAPEGEFARISDFVSSTKTVTISAVTTAVAAGDRYAVADDKINFDTIVQHINMALQDIGYIAKTDTTSVRIAASKTEYSLPAGLANGILREVWIQGQTSDSNDNRWLEVTGWRIQHSDTGTANLLILPYQYATDYYCKLVYLTPHAEMYALADKLDEDIPMNRVVYPAALSVAWWAKQRYQTDDYDSLIVKLEDKAARAIAGFSINMPQPQRRSRKILSDQSFLTMEDSDAGTVYIR